FEPAQLLRPAVGGHPPHYGRAVGKPAADLLDGWHHQHRSGSLAQLAGSLGPDLTRRRPPTRPHAPAHGRLAHRLGPGGPDPRSAGIGLWHSWFRRPENRRLRAILQTRVGPKRLA